MRICHSTGVDWVTKEGYWRQEGWLTKPYLIKASRDINEPHHPPKSEQVAVNNNPQN